MTPMLAIAVKQIREGLRNRWVAAATLVLAALALGLTFLGSAPTGAVAVSKLAVTVVSLASLTIFLVPLIALLISFDTVIGEIERGSMLLLLSYPVRRADVVWGKFLGHMALLTLATVVGYGAAGLGIAVTTDADSMGAGDWSAFALLIGSSVLLGGSFLAMGILASTLVRERATAAGIAVGVWLIFVLLFDLTLLGVLAATGGAALTPELFRWLLLVNPADVFRLLNLTGFADIRQFSGMAGLTDQAAMPPLVLAAALAAWVVLPLLAAQMVFARRQL